MIKMKIEILTDLSSNNTAYREAAAGRGSTGVKWVGERSNLQTGL